MSAVFQHVFVRHVSTDKNRPDYADSKDLQEKIQALPESHIPVSVKGADQGRHLKQSFSAYLLSVGISGPITIFHSGYKRTEATLGYILESMYAAGPVFTIESIREDERVQDVDQGDANNVPYEEARERFPKYAKAIDTHGYLDAVPPGGKSHRQSLEAVRGYLEDLKHVKHDTITITHFSTLVLIRWILEDLSDDQVLALLSTDHPPNASVTRYIYHAKENIWRLEELNRKPWESALKDT